MPTFAPTDISDYYAQTLPHYRFWWKMNQSKAIHYGIWDEHTVNFQEALQNTNIKMADLASVQQNSKVMDAGCGVGGAAFFLADKFGCYVDGISLSKHQIELAKEFSNSLKLQERTRFKVANYYETPFDNNTFDLVWACESLCYADDKDKFFAEANRILKPDGKIVLSDYFITEKGKSDDRLLLKRWGDTWAISKFSEIHEFRKSILENGFQIIENKDFSQQIYKSSRRMYRAYLIGAVPSVLYNLTHRTSRFAKRHYLSGKFQFLALKQKLWEYRIIVIQKAG